MIRLSNFILALMWLDATLTKRVIDSPRLTDLSKIKQSHVAWPANTPLSLRCRADGAKPLNVRWYKNGKLIKPSANIWPDQKWSLKLRKPQVFDSGVYTCVVSNDLGMVKHNYSLSILQRTQSAPVLVPGYPKPVTARVGDNVELECLEQPNGQVIDYRWLKTDSLLKHDPANANKKGDIDWLSPKRYKPFTLDDGDRELHGVKLEMKHVTEVDKGYYTCFLSNNNGFTHGTTFLNVTPILPTDPPEFLIPNNKRKHFLVRVEEEDVKFSCLVRGGAPLKYRWFYNGRLLDTDEKREIRESVLIVRHVQRTDDGVYTCKIRNDYGHVKHNFKLKVLSQEPRYPSHPVLLAGYPKDEKAMIGDSASLFCADITDTLVDYRWLKWNKTMKSFTKADLLNATMFTILHPKYYEQPASNKRGVFLKLKNLTMEDEGLYTCLVSSYMGYSYKSAYLTLQHPPKRHFEPQIPMTSQEKSVTPMMEISSKEEATSKPIPIHHCFNSQEDLSEDKQSDAQLQCQTTSACATIFYERTGEENMFCDEEDLCIKYNVTSGECAKVTFEKVLCCCTGELCNQPSIKLFQKTKKTQSTPKPQVMPVIFVSTIVLTISVMLALLGYRIRQRKAAMREIIVHETRPSSRKLTKQKVMETRWLKEDI